MYRRPSPGAKHHKRVVNTYTWRQRAGLKSRNRLLGRQTGRCTGRLIAWFVHVMTDWAVYRPTDCLIRACDDWLACSAADTLTVAYSYCLIDWFGSWLVSFPENCTSITLSAYCGWPTDRLTGR
jgi:hypothetical protein